MINPINNNRINQEINNLHFEERPYDPSFFDSSITPRQDNLDNMAPVDEGLIAMSEFLVYFLHYYAIAYNWIVSTFYWLIGREVPRESLYRCIPLIGGAGISVPFPSPPIEVPDEIADIAGNYSLNQQRKADRPDPFNFEELMQDVQDVDMNTFIICFDEVYRDVEHFNGSATTELKETLLRYIDFVEAKRPNVPGTSAQYYEDLEKVLKNLIVELQKPSLSVEEKQFIFSEIAEAATQCTPRIYEETLGQFRRALKRPETLDNLVRRWVQEYKEELLLDNFQAGAELHILSHARHLVGDDWGLNNNMTLAKNDPSIIFFLDLLKEDYETVLTESCTPGHYILAIFEKIIVDNAYMTINEHLQREHDQGRLTDEDFQEMYNDKGKLTYNGVAILLENLGFLFVSA